MTDEQLAEYQTIVDLGGESMYWKDKLDAAFISFIGWMVMIGYVLTAVNPKLVITLGILAGAAVLRNITKLRVVETTIEE